MTAGMVHVTKLTPPGVAATLLVGAGIGGLSCAALLGKYGVSVAIAEAHYVAGGAAHSGAVQVTNQFDPELESAQVSTLEPIK
jgi:phytoene dehydrogenase-like protein